uniref:RING-type domain-containing protein n=1 Tax=Panagrellus redivivus TaxID=6233 RepID=A0A7E4UZP5_PANRE
MNECCICNGTYNRTNRAPVTVSCGHTFCMNCTCTKTNGKTFWCPICRTNSFFGVRLNPMSKNLALIQVLDNFNLLASDDIVEAENMFDQTNSAESNYAFWVFSILFIMFLPLCPCYKFCVFILFLLASGR